MTDNEMNYYISNFQSELINGKYIYNNEFSNIGIYSSNQQIDESQYEWQFYIKDLKKKPYYKEVADGDDVQIYGKVRDLDLLSSNLKTNNLNMGNFSNRVLPIYRKVKNLTTGELVGVMEIDVYVSKLINSNSLKESDEEIYHILLDSDRKIVLDTKNASEDLEKMITKSVKSSSGTGVFKLGNETYSIQYTENTKTGLIKAAVMETTGIYSKSRKTTIGILSITMVCLIILVVIAYSVIRNMLKRLIILDHMMEKVKKGDFEVKISDDRREDEITRISKSFNSMASHLNQVLNEKVENEKAKKEAELRALQAQINPHFLYNTLENMHMQCEIEGYYELGDSLTTLSELFRYSIKWGSNEVPFSLEWKNLKNYLSIMQMRFGDNLSCDLKCQEDVGDVVVPKLMLQPLVENCFNHGFKEKLPPWEIKIDVKMSESFLNITIIDNGDGISDERMDNLKQCMYQNKMFHSEEDKKQSIGVVNVKQRIDLLCKTGSSLRIKSEERKGTCVEITIML